MKIILKIDNEDKTFIAPFISTRKLKETLALSEKVQKGFTVEMLDELAEFTVGLYGNQFTIDELLDGYPSNEFFGKVLNDLQSVVGNFNGAIKN